MDKSTSNKAFSTFSVNFKKYDAPTFSESRNKDHINYGSDNQYPTFLIKLSSQSALHSAIVNSVADLTAGDGVNWTIEEGGINSNITDKKLTKYLNAFKQNVNSSETLQSVIKKISLDLKIFGGFCLNIIWSKDRKTIAEIYHCDFSSIRSGKSDEKGIIDEYYFCNDWNYAGKEGYEVKSIKSFDEKNRKQASQLIYVKPYSPGNIYYPLPDYIGCINHISLDFEIGNYWLNLINNNMTPSMFINFNDGIPDSEEEKDIIYAKINNMYTGGDNAGKFILNFSESKETSAEVTPLNTNNLDQTYVVILKEIQQAIITGHKITSPMLVGVKTEGTLGGRNEMIEASELFHNKVIRPKQSLIEQVFEKILYINLNKKIEMEIQNIEPVKFSFSEGILKDILTKDELRSLIGYEPVVIDTNIQPESNIPPSNPDNNSPNPDANAGENTTSPTV